MEIDMEDEECLECGNVEEHPCPFESDVYDNEENYCRCCSECEEQCRENI